MERKTIHQQIYSKYTQNIYKNMYTKYTKYTKHRWKENKKDDTRANKWNQIYFLLNFWKIHFLTNLIGLQIIWHFRRQFGTLEDNLAPRQFVVILNLLTSSSQKVDFSGLDVRWWRKRGGWQQVISLPKPTFNWVGIN